MADATLIGIDIGTGAIKAVLMDLDGNPLATFARPYPTARPRPGHVEQDARDWMKGVLAALDGFAKANDLGGLVGIGLSSQVNTHVFVDGKAEPLLPAMVWQDGRCGEDAAALDARVTAEQKTAWFGGPMPIDASHALARIAHVARLRPDLYARTRHVLLPKDFCALKLTGSVATDPIAAVGLVNGDLAYVDELLDLVPGARERLPPLADFTHRVGTVRSGWPCAGAPVFVGAMDAWAGMFGVGVTRQHDAMYLSGTSEVLGVLSQDRVPTPGVIVFPTYKGITLHVAPTQSGGASLAWLSTLLGRDLDELSMLVAGTPPSPSVPVFLPHLQGERAPLWDLSSRGVFARVDAGTGPGQLSRSVMEGVALSARLAFEATERSAGFTAERLNIGGGGARSDTWCQIRADAFGKVMRRVRVLDAGTLGAAIIAGLGAGAMPSLEAAVDRLVTFERDFEPSPRMRGYYDAKFGKYQDLYADLKPFNAGFETAPSDDA
ncbi:xylulokinase [Bauldia litoralis]|uniref:xylulokinase n=2 Tax=Bauldia litoralis TaxID=665467 RepID=UPI003264F58F